MSMPSLPRPTDPLSPWVLAQEGLVQPKNACDHVLHRLLCSKGRLLTPTIRVLLQ